MSLKNALKAVYKTLKLQPFMVWILPSDRFLLRCRDVYRRWRSIPFLFYALHLSVLYKGTLAGSFRGTYLSLRTSWCLAPYFFLGTYEKELDLIWDSLSQSGVDFNQIWVIGAAEGYYVCGLGRRYQSAFILAYESSEESRAILKTNARLNHLTHRVSIHNECTYPEFYTRTQTEQPDVLLCDIEGYEHVLFSEAILSTLNQTILIIEVHPPYQIQTTVLQNTHVVFQIEPRPRTLADYPLVDLAPNAKKMEWMNERRPFSTPWIVALPKSREATLGSVMHNLTQQIHS